MKHVLIALACAAISTGCATVRTPYETAVRSTVLSVADCKNPEILLMGDAVANVDHEAYFREVGNVAYSFERIKLGPDVVGYRADLIPCGQGWSGYRHGRLFELRDAQLVLIHEQEGPFLFIKDDETVNGRYRLAHWGGDDPRTAKYQYYAFSNGQYMKDELTEAQQPDREATQETAPSAAP